VAILSPENQTASALIIVENDVLKISDTGGIKNPVGYCFSRT
jgi:hypothetical protein